MTISSSEIKKNMTLIIDGELYQVVEWQHRKPPKAPPTLTLRVKSIKNGNIVEKKVQGNRPLTVARTVKQEFQFLFEESDNATFMDTDTFEQISVSNDFLGCLLYTSDAADDSLRVDLGGRRIINKNRDPKK